MCSYAEEDCGWRATAHTGEAAACSACQEGYYKDQGTGACKICNGCATCEAAANTCTSCSEGKYLKTNQCIDGTTTPCDAGTYADPQSNTCAECGIEGCNTCKYNTTVSKPQCTTCGSSKKVKTALDGTTTCVDDAGCAQNDVAGTHFLTKTTNKCLLCNDVSDKTAGNGGVEGCSMCKKTAPSDAVTCTACLDGYYNSGTGTVTCTACTGENCATCAKDTKDQCSTCKPGYFKQGDSPGTCTPCDDTASGIEGCAACTLSTSLTCSSCKPNYRQSGSNPVTCTRACEDETACGGTAGSCDAIVINASGEMTYYCSQCVGAGYGPINGKCSNNLDSNTCKDGVCTQCTNGYFLYMGGCYSTANTPGSLMCSKASTTAGVCETPNANSRDSAVPGQQTMTRTCRSPLSVL